MNTTARLRWAMAMAPVLVTVVTPMPGNARDGQLEEVVVVGSSPTLGAELERFRIPHRVVSIDSEELDRAVSSRLADHLGRRVSGVFINEAQNNPLQPDLQYRGFTLSPLLGLPQGLAVYQDGVRLNEVFGDTLNWELIPENAVDRIVLVSGSDPLYGLNALGGALSVQTRNGFDHPGHRLELDGGSFGRVAPRIESGGNNGSLGYFIAGSYEADDGWRELSETDASNLFANLGWRPSGEHALHLTVNAADSRLIGNGPAPEVLWELEGRESIFTAPDITENEMYLFNLFGRTEVAAGIEVSGNAFYRDNRTQSFNGDGSEFEECEAGGTEYLAEEGEDGDGDEDGNCLADASMEDLRIKDQDGDFVLAEADNQERNAINNRSEREQQSYGGSLQASVERSLAGYANRFLAGLSYLQGSVDFWSTLEIARLLEDRATEGTGLYIPGDGVRLDVDTRNYSAYLSDTFSVTEQLDVTASVRYNDTRIELRDRGGHDVLTEANPDLSGTHDFSRFNPAAGLAWRPLRGLTVFGGYSESNRAPTAVELACADEDAPCNLPNAFLADPPLETGGGQNRGTGPALGGSAVVPGRGGVVLHPQRR